MTNKVKPGQIYRDCDKRMFPRTIRVERVDEVYAYCSTAYYPSGKTIRIRLDRMKPTSRGFDLVKDVL